MTEGAFAMIKGIDHIAIAVADIASAESFLKQAFGLEAGAVEEVPSQGVRVAFFDVGGVSLELLEPLDEASGLHKFLEKRGAGLHHIALRVDDIPSALAHLKSLGVRLIDEEPREGAHGKRIAFVHPKNETGTLIELCE